MLTFVSTLYTLDQPIYNITKSNETILELFNIKIACLISFFFKANTIKSKQHYYDRLRSKTNDREVYKGPQ
jgi:hypothetical protein